MFAKSRQTRLGDRQTWGHEQPSSSSEYVAHRTTFFFPVHTEGQSFRIPISKSHRLWKLSDSAVILYTNETWRTIDHILNIRKQINDNIATYSRDDKTSLSSILLLLTFEPLTPPFKSHNLREKNCVDRQSRWVVSRWTAQSLHPSHHLQMYHFIVILP